MEKGKSLFLLLWLLLMVGCKNEGEGAEQTVMPVAVAEPVVRDVTLTHTYPGYLSADATLQLVARVNGVLLKNNYDPGARVKKGDVLFLIEPDTYRDAVTQAEAKLQTAEAELSYNKENLERMQQAIKNDAVSRIALLQAVESVKQSEANVRSCRAALNQARLSLSYCYVQAPCNGVMSVAAYSAGAYINGASSPVTLGTLYKDDTMYCYFSIPGSVLSEDAVRDTFSIVTVHLDDGTELPRKAHVDYRSPNVSMTTGTRTVRADLANPDGLLKSGAFVTVTLPYAQESRAILVRDASIGVDQQGKYLYVVNDSNRVMYRTIKTGQLIDDSLRMVTHGLQPNERYVTQALLKVRDGMTISPVLTP